MYIDRMKRLRDFIASLPPKKIIMRTYVLVDFIGGRQEDAFATVPSCIPSLKMMQEPSCGTAGCIAGWCAVRFNLFSKLDAADNDDHAFGVASEFLGLSNNEAHALFQMNWPGYLSPFGKEAITYIQLDAFDELPGVARKKAILKVLDWVIDYGFTWLDSEQRSTVYKKFKDAA